MAVSDIQSMGQAEGNDQESMFGPNITPDALAIAAHLHDNPELLKALKEEHVRRVQTENDRTNAQPVDAAGSTQEDMLDAEARAAGTAARTAPLQVEAPGEGVRSISEIQGQEPPPAEAAASQAGDPTAASAGGTPGMSPTGSSFEDTIAATDIAKHASLATENEAKIREEEYKQTSQAMHDVATSELHKQQSQIIESYQTKQANLARQMQDQMQLQMQHFQDAISAYHTQAAMPWSEHSTGWQIGSAIAVGLGQAAVGLQGGQGQNTALQIIEHAHARDLQRQQLALQTRQAEVGQEASLLGHMQAIYKDRDTALIAAKAAMMQLTAQRAQEQWDATAPQRRTLEGQIFVQQAIQKAEQDTRKLFDQSVKNQHDAYQLALNRENAQANRQLRMLGMSMSAPQGLFSELGKISPTKLEKIEKMWAGTMAVGPAFDKMDAILASDPSLSDRGQYQEFMQQASKLKEAYRSLFEAGANFSESEQKLGNAILMGDQSYLESLARTGEGRKLLQEGKRTLEQKLDAELKTRTGKPFTYWAAKYQDLEAPESEQ